MTYQDELFLGTKRHSKLLNRMAIPLRRYGLTHVGYYNVRNDGLVSNVVQHRKWMEVCMEHELYKNDVHLVNPQWMTPGIKIDFDDAREQDESYNFLCNLFVKFFHSGEGISFVFKDHLGYQTFTICGPDMHGRMSHDFDILFSYFQRICANLRLVSEDSLVPISSLKSEEKLNKPGIIYRPTERAGLIESLEKRSPKKGNTLITHKNGGLCLLTDQQLKCLSLYQRGFTAKDTANELGISPRTVESHWMIIKRKLGIRYKKQALEI